MPRLTISLAFAFAVAFGLGTGNAVAAAWNTLLAPAELSTLIDAGEVTVVDIRVRDLYAAGHIRGSLNAPYQSWRGPEENPGARLSDARLTERLQSLGLTPENAVAITYRGANTTDFGAVARVYWTLKSAGLTRIAILNGDITAR